MAGAVPRLLLCAVLVAAAGAARQTWPTPLVRAYAHNDQENGDPLLPALNAGFCNVEPDVFLQDGVVVIGHNCNLVRHFGTVCSLF